MSTTTIVSPTPVLYDEARLAVAGFLARYSGPTRTSYATDLRQFFSWCAQLDLSVFAAQRGHVELWARAMEEKGLSRATIGRRLSMVAGFYRIAVLDGLLEHSPAEHVRRPKIDTDSATLGLEPAPSRTRSAGKFLVGRTGLEPVTPCASCKCATSCANGPTTYFSCSEATFPLSGKLHSSW